MTISEQEFFEATARGEALRSKGHATRAEYDAEQKCLVVDLNTGLTIVVPVQLIEGLAGAQDIDITDITLTPSGLALHWDCLDADIYVPSLLHSMSEARE